MASGQRTAKSSGRPDANGEDADVSHKRVFTWFAGRRRKRQPKRAKRPHSKSSGRKALDGPATRPVTPLAVENSVGKLAAVGAQCQHGKESVANSHPPLWSPSSRKAGRGLSVL